jgi:hypothetical protein
MMTRELTIGDFASRRGHAFKLEVPGSQLQLTLAHVQELPPSGREGGAFRLEFHGPLQPLLPQGIYSFPIGAEQSGIFIVPIGATGDAMRYEAIFY